MKKPAFTMLELVIVIVILGILASLALPRMERDVRQESGDNILSAIRYTQHMALSDNVTDPSNIQWQKSFWRFGIQGCSDDGVFYYIGADKNTEGNIDDGEEAIEPSSGLRINGLNTKPCEGDLTEQTEASPDIFITKKYGITDGNVVFSGCNASTGKYIGFDHLGRPHRGFVQNAAGLGGATSPDYSSLCKTDTVITLKFDDTNIPDISITIEKETGYSYISTQENS